MKMQNKWIRRFSRISALYILTLVSCLSTLLMIVYNRSIFIVQRTEIFHKENEINQFRHDWCRVRRFEKDWQLIQAPCMGKLAWEHRKPQSTLRTDANTSFISSWNLQPVGQFSRFYIQSVDMKGNHKQIGGDSWRVTIRQGPSSLAPFVFDLQNGRYEILFLVLEPGNYTVQIYLDYTLCDGLREPPPDWFVKGNYQGKLQPNGTLGDISQDYIMQELNRTGTFHFSIRNSAFTLNGYYKYFQYRKNSTCSLKLTDIDCGSRCKKLWDGHGRWVGYEWRQHSEGYFYEDFHKPRVEKNGTIFWMIGDSNIHQLYNQVVNGMFCEKYFETCQRSYNWIYEVNDASFKKGISAESDGKDFNETIVLSQLQNALDQPQMQHPDSVLLLNYGLHYSLTLNFTAYKRLLSNIIRMVTEQERNENGDSVMKLKARVIWKGTTYVEREKLYMMDQRWGSYHTTHWRFHTNHRHSWFSAYATTKLCEAGIPVIELYPMTIAYPDGTKDSVHFADPFLVPVRKALEGYFGFESKKRTEPYSYYLKC